MDLEECIDIHLGFEIIAVRSNLLNRCETSLANMSFETISERLEAFCDARQQLVHSSQIVCTFVVEQYLKLIFEKTSVGIDKDIVASIHEALHDVLV